MPQAARDQLLEISDAADVIAALSGRPITGDGVRYFERLGRLPCVRTARGVRLFRRADVERFAAERQVSRRRGGPSREGGED